MEVRNGSGRVSSKARGEARRGFRQERSGNSAGDIRGPQKQVLRNCNATMTAVTGSRELSTKG